jgi:hypothetical protein
MLEREEEAEVRKGRGKIRRPSPAVRSPTVGESRNLIPVLKSPGTSIINSIFLLE